MTTQRKETCSCLSEFVMVAFLQWTAMWGQQKRGENREQDKHTHIISSSFDLLVESVLVFIPKGWVPHQQDVEDDTCPGEEM